MERVGRAVRSVGTAAVRRTGLRTCAFGLLGALGVCVAGCGTFVEARTPAQVIKVTPADGAKRVPAGEKLRVSVVDGTLKRVRVTLRSRGARHELPGRISRDGGTWLPEERRLRLGSKYAVDVVAEDADGRRSARHTTFTTKPQPRRVIGFFTPEHRQTVGTGMIVSIRFNRPIEDRAAVERAVRVTAKPRVRVAPHWFGGSRLDFRPQEFWKPGTRVTLDLRLRGVRAAPSVYGVQRKRVHFDVGRDQRSVVDAGRHMMTVQRDGTVVNRVPVTAGSAKNRTYEGHMVVSEKFEVTRMNARTVGFGGEYDIEDVPHAMRLTESGTFLHGNYWAPRRTFGRANVSHGCIGLHDKKGGDPRSAAGAFYRSSLVGDVVTVRNSGERTVAPGNGLGGWNMPWREWTAGSVLD
ncbi:Lipoprotein-anchoring transpeptidase ErfK/SrfK [Streptomyces sp. WMMB 714]|uniref:L,D-transpeptidase n=1 Tax=Streptomyces sp. WMMB 714 TaxID=1286822 RepID=UPI0005F81690|nr:Ig-like domain-containing protein [Streptomyces sp. WMMB 714]SCK35323.1 Lipoprotein-anchoring transpeptidase ErfK/SrfK [Streptomyces sp. WMMB 714]